MYLEAIGCLRHSARIGCFPLWGGGSIWLVRLSVRLMVLRDMRTFIWRRLESRGIAPVPSSTCFVWEEKGLILPEAISLPQTDSAKELSRRGI